MKLDRTTEKKKIQDEWIENSEIKMWPVFCIICKVNLKLLSRRSYEIIYHMEYKKHRDAAKAINQPKIDEHYPSNNGNTKGCDIRLALFLVEHN